MDLKRKKNSLDPVKVRWLTKWKKGQKKTIHCGHNH